MSTANAANTSSAKKDRDRDFTKLMDGQFAEMARCLETRIDLCPSKKVLLGFDGAVDKILSAVGTRHGPGASFQALPSIDSFGSRISAGAGRSVNIELHLRYEKLGGNGPIMAGALAPSGVAIRYLGPLGSPEIAPVFRELAEKVEVCSLGDPVLTHAVEFEDGKVMLPVLTPYDQITPERLLEKVGRDRLRSFFDEADLICLVCWTFLPHMCRILDFLLRDLLPEVPGNPSRRFFFDLADPAIRTVDDLQGVLQQIRAFQAFGPTTLGMNFSEAVQVCRALELSAPEENPQSLREAAAAIRERLGIAIAMIHPTSSAACAVEGESFHIPGPYCSHPTITTGAGDHLNAGFTLGLLLDFSPHHTLQLGVLYSGYYVRTGHSPTPRNILDWIQNGDCNQSIANDIHRRG